MPAPCDSQGTIAARLRACAVVLACAVLAASSTARAGAAPRREYEIKAAFLYHFARYVEWPEEDPPTPRDAFVIAVVGRDPFGGALDRIASTRTVGNRKIAVRRFESPDDCAPCDVLFVSSSEADRLHGVLARTKGAHTLVVGDTKGFARRGVAINFFIERNKVRFEINPAAARRAGLKISSKLLRLARIVRDLAEER